MKRIGIWIISAVCMVIMNTAWADEGGTIFKSQGCMPCHKKESTSKVNSFLLLKSHSIPIRLFCST